MTDDTYHDDFAWHEAIDRTAVLLDVFSRHVEEHPIVAGDGELNVLAEAAGDALQHLYQRLCQRAPHMRQHGRTP